MHCSSARLDSVALQAWPFPAQRIPCEFFAGTGSADVPQAEEARQDPALSAPLVLCHTREGRGSGARSKT